MSAELFEKLKNDIDSCDWEALLTHFERGAILVVDSSIGLAHAGVALAQDDTEKVKPWIEKKHIYQPSIEDKKNWEKEPRKKFAKFLIIQPYVLIELVSEPTQ